MSERVENRPHVDENEAPSVAEHADVMKKQKEGKAKLDKLAEKLSSLNVIDTCEQILEAINAEMVKDTPLRPHLETFHEEVKTAVEKFRIAVYACVVELVESWICDNVEDSDDEEDESDNGDGGQGEEEE